MAGILGLPNADILFKSDVSYIVEEDFEDWNDNAWTVTENGTGSSVTVVAGAAYKGSFGARLVVGSGSVSAPGKSARIEKTFTDVYGIYLDCRIRFKSITVSSGDKVEIIQFRDSVYGWLGHVSVEELNGSYYLSIEDDWGNDEILTDQALGLDTWYHLVVYFKAANGITGAWEVDLDEVSLYSNTAIRTTTGDYDVDELYLGPTRIISDTDEVDIDLDEVYVDDDAIAVSIEPDDEVILALMLHLGCTKEISSFEAVLDRGNPDYDQKMDPGETNALSTGLETSIYLGRGSNKPLLLTGQIEEIDYEDQVEEYQFRNVVRIRGRCQGYQLFGRKYDGDLISDVGTGTKNYEKSSGDASSCVAYLIDNYTSLSHSRVNDDLASNAAADQTDVVVEDGTKFAANDLVKIKDDNGWEYQRIASITSNTLTMANNLTNSYATADSAKVYLDLIERSSTAFTQLKYSHTTIFDILRFICDVSDLSGAIGYEMRVEYDGKFSFFPKETKAESYSLSDECQYQSYLKDASRIKNRITVFGKKDKPYPLDADGQAYSDEWTETYSQNLVAVSQDIAADQKDIKVAENASDVFSVGDWLWITDTKDGIIGEIGQIAEITKSAGNDDTITLEDNISSAYTTANYAVVWEVGSDRAWGYLPQGATNDFSISLSGSPVHTGSYSVEVVFNNALSAAYILFVLPEGSEANMDDYPVLKGMIRFASTAPELFQVTLYSGSCGANNYAVSSPIGITQVDQWAKFEVLGGSDNADAWVVGSSMDWTDIKVIVFTVLYSAAGTYTFNIDRLHYSGKRWGGGNNNAASDGFAEDTSSQTTYGLRELVVISELLLSDAECEAKAQALLDFYKSERITLEVVSNNVDWTNYRPAAGNTVGLDLDSLGVTGETYRIDTIVILFRAEDNSLTASYTLGKTPKLSADYTYSLSRKVRELERKYENIR